MKNYLMKYRFIIIFIVLSVGVKAQTYECTWHLIKKIENSDTTKMDLKIQEGSIQELTIRSEKVNSRLKDTIIEDNIEFILIGIEGTIEKYIGTEMTEEYEEASCPCFFYQGISEQDLFYQFCESQRKIFHVELKNKELHLTTLRKFDWREGVFKKQKTREVYIYTRVL